MLKIVVLLVLALVLSNASPENTYTNKYDDIDLDQVLQNERLLDNYVKCLKNVGPCTPDAAELKKVMPDSIATDCAKCTKKQKEGVDKVTKFLSANKPKVWEELEAIYDPQGLYKNKKYQATPEKTMIKTITI